MLELLLMPKKRYTAIQMRQQIAKHKWIMRYNYLAAVVDPKVNQVLYIESYGPERGFFIEGWRATHYPLTSKIVLKAWREGGVTLVLIKPGRASLTLKPSIAPFGISECKVTDTEVKLSFAGLGGAGVSAAYSRGAADGVKYSEMVQQGGGAAVGKGTITLDRSQLLLIGVDDTDNAETGATYALVHNIASEAAQKFNVAYVIHVNVQLYPYNKFKTRNCFATVVGFLHTKKAQRQQVIDYFKSELLAHTVSNNTAMACASGFWFSDKFIDYATSLKFRFASDLQELKDIASNEGVQMYPITGERGLFGAVSALAFFDKPDYAAKLPTLLN